MATQMKNTINKPSNLISLTDTFGNQKINYKNRINKNFQAWVKFQDKANNNCKKGITDYANELLEGKLAPLYKLVYDYAGSRIFITKRKSEITEKIRKVTHASNIEQQLREMLLQAYNDFRISGAIRNTDAAIINRFK